MNAESLTWSERYEKALGGLLRGAEAGKAFGWVYRYSISEYYETPVVEEVRRIVRFLDDALRDWDRFPSSDHKIVDEALNYLQNGDLYAFVTEIDLLEEAMAGNSLAAKSFGPELIGLRRTFLRKRMDSLLKLVSRAAEDPAYMLLHELYRRAFQHKKPPQEEGNLKKTKDKTVLLFFDIWLEGITAEKLTKILGFLRVIRVDDKDLRDPEAEKLAQVLEQRLGELEIEELWSRSTSTKLAIERFERP